MIFTAILNKKIMVKVTDLLGFDPENMVIYRDLTKKHGDSNGDFMRCSWWCHSDFIQFQCVFFYSDGISWIFSMGSFGALVRQKNLGLHGVEICHQHRWKLEDVTVTKMGDISWTRKNCDLMEFWMDFNIITPSMECFFRNLQMHRTWKIWKTHYLYSILETLFHTFPRGLYQKTNAQISVLKRSKHVSSVQIIPKFEEVSFHLFFWACYE